ncbi:Hypothetical predicted protein [Olea europaea subsp. europaea]|uniref:FLZ-type domain-containing protein n=1 Tax=Olea europaea subsp. europaea TaxID=158383 RepID=A0A8S0PC16_OLEEU|nr:Hypothetical predicted protein [Olea europaea subsp. europaea]
MLRNKSRAMTSPRNPKTSISSFLGSPRFFLAKNLSDAESVAMSPTSILDTKNSSNSANPFGYDKNLSTSSILSPNSCNKQDSEAIGLALIDSMNDEKNDGDFSKPISRMVVFGSKLKVQIPTLVSASISPVEESPKSPADFGIKTRDSQLMSPFSRIPVKDSPQSFTRQLSLKEMELSEDYTCVITHGPNPKTTHIFDNCIVESCCGDHPSLSDNCEFEANFSVSPSVDFLSCHTCKTSLGDDGKDVYMYRGGKAFCSQECRCQEMLSEGIKNPELDDSF